MPIKRRKFLQSAVLLPGVVWSGSSIFSLKIKSAAGNPFQRVRPGDPLWPSDEKWRQLKNEVNGNLLKLESPFASCGGASNTQTCEEIFKGLKNPYFIGDNPALTQTSGWLNAWRSESSAYAVTAKSTHDVVAAVNFARENHLRLVVKGGGHSYKGTSNAPDSLLIWTRAMNQVIMYDDFVAEGFAGSYQPQPAVTIDAGAMWLHAYDAVITKGGRYVQGGGCLTVGVAGLIQGGGFGSFSKYYGLAAAALLEAEIVTADGSVKKANACTNPDLFWALKGGGGGSFGVVTKLTLRTRELPENFGAVFCTIRAASEKDFIALIKKFISHYAEMLFNPAWGEQVRFRSDNSMSVNMLFHGLSKEQADAAWLPFIQWVKETPGSYTVVTPFNAIAIPPRNLWDTAFLKKYASQTIETDDRPNAPESNVYWKTNREEAGQFLYGYHSAWMPESLLAKDNQSKLADALFSASRHWSVTLHFNKGLAGAHAEEITAARNTAMNPDVLTAFALIIIAGEGEPAFTGIQGHEPDLKEAARSAGRIQKSMNEIKKVAPHAGSYLTESDYFEQNWQQSYWGSNYSKLLQVKNRYDPDGLFFVHHGVGSESWSDDGFTKIK